MPTDRLIDAVWGGTPPDGVANSLQVLVSKLRKALSEGSDTARAALRSHAPGYRLQVPREDVDMFRFERLVEEAREDRLDGNPVADFSYEPFAQATIQRLEELRVSALEDVSSRSSRSDATTSSCPSSRVLWPRIPSASGCAAT